MSLTLPINIDELKGFLAADEAQALYDYALSVAERGPVLEVGSYCGKSTIYLAMACREKDSQVFAVDHHVGSEEHQFGEMFHDPELYNSQDGIFDTFAEFRRNIRRCELQDVVVPLVATSAACAKFWSIPLAMVFIDGGHSLEAALSDFRCWSGQIMRGGILAIHDLFPAPELGGQAPIGVYRIALQSGLFEEVSRVNSLGVLRRL